MKKITLPLHEYLDDLLGNNEKTAVELVKAQIISGIDKDEQFVHVQFNELDGGLLREPLVWRIKEWKQAYLKWQIDKKKSAEDRRQACVRQENVDLVVRLLVKKFGGTDEMYRGMARKAIVGKKFDALEKHFGIKCERS